MKIRRLDLIAFGPFTNVSLDFGNQPGGLHIVCGPNEAGKSSSLRALHQLLFGIPHNSRDNFLHPNQNLRIGAVLEDSSGEIIECIRRKGRVNTLRGADDVTRFDSSVLEQMLAGIDADTFSRQFGIDYRELRAGGQSVVEGGGDLGGMLFAAGTGVADLGRIQKQLSEEAEQLFKPKGSKPAINHGLAELKVARRQIKEAQLRTADWEKHDRALQDANRRVAEMDERLLALKTEKSRLERLGRAWPLIAKRERVVVELGEVGEAALLSDDFAAVRREALARLRAAEKDLADTKARINNLTESLAGMQVPQPLLEHRSAITRLFKELGSYQKAAKDRPRLVARLEQLEGQAGRLLTELGREPNLEGVEELRIPAAERHRLQALANDYKALQLKATSAEQALSDLRREIELADSQLACIDAPPHPTALLRAVRAAKQHGDIDTRLTEARDALQRLDEQAFIDLDRLPLWQGSLEELERLPVPALETVDRFEDELGDAQRELIGIESCIDEATGRFSQLDRQLESLRLEQNVPTEEELWEARKQRDMGWQHVLCNWQSGSSGSLTGADEFIARFSPTGDLASAFESSLETADHIADRLRREADRVAERARLTAERQELEQRLEELNQARVAKADKLHSIQRDWRRTWTAAKLEPLLPREMRSWLNQHAQLIKLVAEARKQRQVVLALEDVIRTEKTRLRHCLAAHESEYLEDDSTLASLLEHGEQLLETLEVKLRQREELRKTQEQLRNKLGPCTEASRRANQATTQWKQDWKNVVGRLGLEADSDPLAASAVMASVDKLFAILEDADDTRHRIRGIDRDAEQFTGSVNNLLSEVCPELLQSPIDQAVADLHDRLEAASQAQIKREGWHEQLTSEQRRLEEAESQRLQCRTKLETMCCEAGCDDVEELPQAESRSARRKDLEHQLRLLNEQLLELAATSGLETFMVEARQQEPDQLRASMQLLEAEIEGLETAKSEEHRTIGEHQTELRRMDGSGRAAEARDRVEHLLAGLRNDAEQYTRLRLASAVLRGAIERFRETSQGPVLRRASEYFRELTRESFAGLRADYDEQGNTILVGVRPEGSQIIRVEGMSEGTCDQLYLALRLALLDTYLARNAPLPFIVDDILIMFDDERAVAALHALMSLAEHTQVIYFTHHNHIVSLARRHFGSEVEIHALNYRETAVC